MPINPDFQNCTETQENTTDLAVQLCLNGGQTPHRLIAGMEPGQGFARPCTAAAAAGFAPTAWVGAIAAELAFAGTLQAKRNWLSLELPDRVAGLSFSLKRVLQIKSWSSVWNGKTVAGLLVPPVWLWHPALPRDQQKVLKRCGPAALRSLLGKGLCTSFPPSGLEMVLCMEREKNAAGVAFPHSRHSSWTILTVDMKSLFQ